jgi:2-iminobutanoate/2-iminopropanoate deaminase
VKNTLSAAFLICTCILIAGWQATPSRRYINPALANDAKRLPFTDAVIAGNTMYVGGILGVDKDGKVPAKVDQEIQFALDEMKRVLAEGGMTMDDLVSVQVFCPDLKLYEQFNAAYRTYFSKELPARAFIGSGPLLRGAHFELVGVAVRR